MAHTNIVKDLKKIFNLKILNLGRNIKNNVVSDTLKEKGVTFRTFRKDPKKEFGVVSFENDEDRQKGKVIIETLTNKSGNFYSTECYQVQQKNEISCDGAVRKTAKDAVCPFADVPYHRQLMQKQKKMAKVLQQFLKSQARAENKTQSREMPPWVLERKSINSNKQPSLTLNEDELDLKTESNLKRRKLAEGTSTVDASQTVYENLVADDEESRKEHSLDYWSGDVPCSACSLEKILASPKQDGYRNKCEFTIGHDAEGIICVGFRVGGGKQGCFEVSSPNECLTVPKVA